MARPGFTASPQLTALLGEDTTRHLTAIVGTDSARDLDRQLSELAQLGQLKTIRTQLQLQAGLDQIDRRQLAEQLAMLGERIDKLAARLEQVERHAVGLGDMLDQLAANYERALLESQSYVVQANEVIRRLREDVQQLPHQVATATAVAVGVVLGRDELVVREMAAGEAG